MEHARSVRHDGLLLRIAAFAFLWAVLASIAAAPASAATLERVKGANKLTLAYEVDARPFSFKDDTGKAAGYAVDLCQRVADAVKAELDLPSLNIEWVPISVSERLETMQQGKADLLCGADSVTLTRRKAFGFSLPIFPGGIGALLRADSPAALQEVLTTGHPASRPLWRGYPARTLLEEQTFSIVGGTTSEKWLANRISTFQLSAKVEPVETYASGVQKVLDRSTNVFFGDLSVLRDAAKHSPSASDLIVLDRNFTYEPFALPMERGDEDFRLLVDRVLSQLYRSDEFELLYAKWFGEPDGNALRFFRQTALPE